MPVPLSNIFDPADLDAAVSAKFVKLRRHPHLPYTIADYTDACTYGRAWNDVTLACRGLIFDDDGNVVARPFAKFFNFGERDLPAFVATTVPTSVTDKVDGSVGVVYPTGRGSWAVSTRGSFTSPQALHATQLLERWVAAGLSLDPDRTVMVEIVYPQNRVVVDNGELDTLVLLAVIDNATGADVPLTELADRWPGPVAEHHDVTTLDDAVELATSEAYDDREGLVVCWARPGRPAFRLKLKHPRYLLIHRLLAGCTQRRIWEILAAGDDPLAVLEGAPDEAYRWAEEVTADLRARHAEIVAAAAAVVASLPADADRRTQAQVILASGCHSGAAFALLDGKDPSALVWKVLRPERTAPLFGQLIGDQANEAA